MRRIWFPTFRPRDSCGCLVDIRTDRGKVQSEQGKAPAPVQNRLRNRLTEPCDLHHIRCIIERTFELWHPFPQPRPVRLAVVRLCRHPRRALTAVWRKSSTTLPPSSMSGDMRALPCAIYHALLECLWRVYITTSSPKRSC